MNELIADFEAKIRANKVGEVHAAINAMSFADVSRVHVAKMANLALRSGALFWAIRLLNPIVRSNSAGIKATPEELAEYGFALNRIGAHSEAERVLKEIAHHPIPRIQIYLAAIHANAWDYASAKACFEKYLSFAELTPYERRIGNLNLASSLIGIEEEFGRASEILASIREEAEREQNRLLLGNALELSAQLSVKMKDYTACAKWIEAGQKIFPDVDSIFSLFFMKWRNVMRMRTGDGDPHLLMKEVRDLAHRLQHHETIREADFYLAMQTGDEALFTKLYFGTPWPHYRERLAKMKPEGFEFGASYDHQPSGSSEIVLEVSSQRAQSGQATMKAGQLLHRLLFAMTADLYRPVWVAAAFTSLFPEEFYHPDAGPKRVHQAVFRLRQWFAEAKLPLDLEENNGRYSISMREPCVIRLERSSAARAASADEISIEKLVSKFGEGEFGSQDAAKVLEMSPTSTREALKWGVENGRLAKVSSGPRTRYKKIS